MPDRRLHSLRFDRYPSAGMARWVVLILLVVSALAISVLAYRDAFLGTVTAAYDLIADRQRLSAWVAEAGAAAPVVFIGLQVLQVLLAPVPGEATGFIGGVLFGAGPGFVYSTVGLTLGSVLNFVVGRVLGRGVVRRWVPERHMGRFDRLMHRQGAVAAFVLFVIPGFPKDYLCLFLGLSRMSLRLFLPLVAIGRIPGTLMLSFQGAALAERSYAVLGALSAVCILILVLIWIHRGTLYCWIERLEKSKV